MKRLGELIPEIDPPELADEFELFYQNYPRRTDKKAAKRAWDKLSEKDRLAAASGSVYHAENNPQWQDKTLIPHPSTFLNGRRWEDEIVIPQQQEVAEDVSDIPAMVWSACTQMYGQSWINKHGAKPSPVWKTQLAKFKREDILRGLRHLLENGEQNPPGLPYFVQMCRSNALPPLRQLPRPDGNPAVAESALKELKSILRVK